MNVKIKKKGNLNSLTKSAKKLNKSRAQVGYLEKNELAMIAGVHEFGARIRVTDKMRGYLAATGLPLKASTTEIVIPERSFLRTGAKESEKEVRKIAEKYFVDALTGGMSTDVFATKLGEALKEGIQKTAEDISNPKQHAYTSETQGDNQPLHDTGKMIKAIEVKVK